MSPTDDLLNESTVGAYLVSRGLASAGRVGPATRLSGGVSNVVLRVSTENGDVVVKQALSKLAVKDPWYADRSRAQVEAAALHLLGRISPQFVPALLDDDPARHALVLRAAPHHWSTWKSRLLHGDAEPGVAVRLGRLLARWHEATSTMDLDERFHDREVFRQLRIQPYFATSARRCPELAAAVLRVARDLEGAGICLVLGDFSPKNILVGAGPELWVIDPEVAHRGDPSFDVAFMATHLLLKALHVAPARDRLYACLRAFAAGYGDGPGARDAAHLRSVVGCLLLARVVGSSPVEYLTGAERDRVRAAAGGLLEGIPGAGAWWEAVEW
jgi:5-methylthioribose kinase